MGNWVLVGGCVSSAHKKSAQAHLAWGQGELCLSVPGASWGGRSAGGLIQASQLFPSLPPNAHHHRGHHEQATGEQAAC